jgi:hypothetical protein
VADRKPGPLAASRGERYAVRPLDTVDAEPDFERILEAYRDRIVLAKSPSRHHSPAEERV